MSVGTGFGKFNIKVAIVCGLIYMNTGFGISSVGFVLPSAACDLDLTTVDKGRMSATPILGMVAGSYFWGCFAEVQGRRVALLVALFLYAAMEIASSLVSSYRMFLLLKFFSGWAVNGQGAMVFTYLGEFLSGKFREKILCWMEMAWTVGLIVLPLIAWVVIPLDLAYATDKFLFRSWNLFIVVCAVPSLLIASWLLRFPETPKYLAETNQDAKLSRVLESMYHENTGGSFDEYLDKLRKSGDERLRARLAAARNLSDGRVASVDGTSKGISIGRSESKCAPVRNALSSFYEQTLRLWKPPFLRSTLMACGLMYCVGSSYYALMLWFPEVFHRFEAFEKSQPGESSSVCKISSINRTTIMDFSSETPPARCRSEIESNVYLHTLILGLSCVPVSIVLPLFVDTFGYKFCLTLSTATATTVTVGLFFAKSATQNLVLSCIFEAFSSLCMSIILCLIVDLFPTDLRVMAAALSAFFARLGALVGNTLFGYLIDDYCVPLIAVIASQLFLSTILSLLIPGKSHGKSSTERS